MWFQGSHNTKKAYISTFNSYTVLYFVYFYLKQTWKELSESSGQSVTTQPVGLVATSSDVSIYF